MNRLELFQKYSNEFTQHKFQDITDLDQLKTSIEYSMSAIERDKLNFFRDYTVLTNLLFDCPICHRAILDLEEIFPKEIQDILKDRNKLGQLKPRPKNLYKDGKLEIVCRDCLEEIFRNKN